MRRCLSTLLGVLLTLSAGLFARGDEAALISYNALTEAHMDSLIVARVGPIAISAKEFLLGFEYSPAFVKRVEDSPQRYLEFLINEKLLSLDGLAGGLTSTTRVSETLAEIEGDLATEELFKLDVLSGIALNDEEIAKAVQREKMHLSLQWLYAQNTAELRHLQTQLSAGVTFDSLVPAQFSDSVAVDDRSMEITKFRLDGKNPHLSRVVDTLTFGTVSSPVPGPDGWYLVKIADGWQNAVTSESENRTLRRNVQRVLFKRKMDQLSDQYVQEMMADNAPVIERTTFNPLVAYISKQLLPEEEFAKWDLSSRALAEFGPFNISQISVYEDQPLIRMRHDVIPLKDFLIWYRTRESNLHLRHATPQQFILSLQQAVWQMARNHLLVQRATQRGLQNREIVQTQKQWWQGKIVQAVVKSRLSESVVMDEAALRAYYRSNLRDYRQPDGEAIPFKKAEQDVRRDYFATEYKKILFHRIRQLQQQYPIKIYDNVLADLAKRYPISADPKAIDVFVVKKGGTFPRPAFPSIDMDWMGWY